MRSPILLTIFILAGSLHAQTAPPGTPAPRPLPKMIGDDWVGAKKFVAAYTGESVEPDISFKIVRVQRVSLDRVAMSIIVIMDPNSKQDFYMPRGYSPVDKGDPSIHLDPTFEFSLEKAQIVDEGTGTSFPTTKQGGGDPYLGTSMYAGVLIRGGGAFMGAYFKCPPPNVPTAKDPNPKPLTVSVVLPTAKKAITKVVIPDVISQEP